jgi:hypothetical protein
MLGLQASNLEQQERLFKNQIRLGLREILQQELSFYNNAFNNISGCASILAGFSFTGLMLNPYDNKNELQPDWLQKIGDEQHNNFVSRLIETCFNSCCAVTTCLCLLTVVYSNYLGLFATRLALRGGKRLHSLLRGWDIASHPPTHPPPLVFIESWLMSGKERSTTSW